MTKLQHNLYIGLFVFITVAVLAILIFNGYGYYSTPLEERFFDSSHNVLKPSGVIGHGIGIIGSILMIIGVGVYMLRKRVKSLMRLGILKHWLELHIFLCTVGPILVLFHTAFKFGGIVAVSFWSMVAVWLSGIIGRFIYVRIPHTIEGKEMSIQQINNIKDDITFRLATEYNLDNETIEKIDQFEETEIKNRATFSDLLFSIIPIYFKNKRKIKIINKLLVKNDIHRKEKKGDSSDSKRENHNF